jgi:gluconokinase
MAYLIGVDIGTTNVKAVAFNLKGDILGEHSEDYPMYHPHVDWSEQEPEEIIIALEDCIRKVVRRLRSQGELLGLSFSAAMHSLIALNANGDPLTRSIIWADNRSADLANTLRSSEAGRRIYESNGTPIHAMAPVCKLLWLRKNEPEIFRNAARFVSIKEYVLFRLTGKYLVDFSIASATGLFNIRQFRWDEWTLNYLGLAPERFSEPVPPYHTEYLSEANTLDLPAGTPIILGASDGCLANLGSGAIVTGTMAVTVGTSGAVRICTPTPYTDPEMRTFCYILDENTYVVGGATNNGAVVLQWLKEGFFPDLDYPAMVEKAAQVAIGADGLLCLPYLLGERAPLWNSGVRGGFIGLDIHHTGAHFTRAVLEGILLNLFSIGKVLTENVPIHTIYANGGFAKNETWVQMLADIFGLTVHLNDTVETGSVGAAMVGFRALGLLDEKDELAVLQAFTPVMNTFSPDLKNHEAYSKLYENFIQWAYMLNQQSKENPYSSRLIS